MASAGSVFALAFMVGLGFCAMAVRQGVGQGVGESCHGILGLISGFFVPQSQGGDGSGHRG